jgi:hypothetical protein
LPILFFTLLTKWINFWYIKGYNSYFNQCLFFIIPFLSSNSYNPSKLQSIKNYSSSIPFKIINKGIYTSSSSSSSSSFFLSSSSSSSVTALKSAFFIFLSLSLPLSFSSSSSSSSISSSKSSSTSSSSSTSRALRFFYLDLDLDFLTSPLT